MPRSSPVVVRRNAGLLALASALVTPAALAQGTDAAAAETLYQEGVRLFDSGQLNEACAKLEESQRLDAATGTLLSLGVCHEQQGKLASAWAEFTEAQGRARRENRADRVQFAGQHVQALKARLSILQIEVPPEVAATPGLTLKRDGLQLGSGSWNTFLPIDGGEHRIEASAPGRRGWATTVVVGKESERAQVTVPALVSEALSAAPAPSVPTPSVASEAPPPPSEADSGRSWSGLEWAGVASASAGLVAWGIGGYFLGSALGRDHNHQQGAESQGNRATWFGIGGAALVATGVTLFVVGSSSRPTEPALAIAFMADLRQPGALLEGSF